ncbi:MAG: hypothetical protein UT63_C0012G0005 [Candidatus Gottesmanbacteria bacterium GW2011_GWC2_39_8]|uniref:Uncharacterized protein n=1 Tax=Candidatus Gottesmanbacteria bacterium GW2011_GWC2_39_8 TaxID=1618450 RepID=A0A0G0Q8T4_9BACT|nr:MAG: hypothetical protein UT63_C0012G0005 [Candidatus Gottesmanbacteria bacterium GW2011_GWC2_39_8]
MLKKIVLRLNGSTAKWLYVLIILFFVFKSPVFAQTPTSGPPTCDLCGLCQGQPAPSNWNSCHSCLYEGDIPTENAYWTVIGCVSTSPEGFLKSIFSFLLSIAGGISFLALLYGGAVILMSSGNPERLNSGKEIFISSIVGLLLILFSVFLLKVVGFDILRIPGFA